MFSNDGILSEHQRINSCGVSVINQLFSSFLKRAIPEGFLDLIFHVPLGKLDIFKRKAKFLVCL